MAHYKASDMIRMTRIALGISQETLADGICSVQTLSRIENGRTGIKQEIYQQLMERLGRFGEKSFSVISVQDYDSLEIMDKANQALMKFDFIELDKQINKLKPYMKDTIINNLYLKRKEIMVAYKLNKINTLTYIEQLEEVLKTSVSDYHILLEKTYPFYEYEIAILVTIANGYGKVGNNKKKIGILDMLLRSLKAGYMDEKNAGHHIIIIMGNIAKAYGEMGKYEEAVVVAEEAIQIAKAEKNIHCLPNLFAEIAWNMIQQIEKGERSKSELEECKKLLRQGYAAAALYGKDSIKFQISSYYQEVFGKEVYEN